MTDHSTPAARQRRRRHPTHPAVVHVGPGQTIEGRDLTGSLVTVEGGKLIGCTLGGTPDGKVCLTVLGADSEVGWCDMGHVAGRGISVEAAGSTVAPHIHHSYFHDWIGQQGTNVHEVIQLGKDAAQDTHSLRATVAYCLFDGTEVDSEVISVKSSNNLIRCNTLVNIRHAMLMNRHGAHNQYIGNHGHLRVLGGPGIITDHQGLVEFTGGDVTQEEFSAGGGRVKGYPVARGWRVARLSQPFGKAYTDRRLPPDDPTPDDSLPVVDAGKPLTTRDVGPGARR